MTQDFSELGRRALGLALAAVRGEEDATVELIEPTLTRPRVDRATAGRRRLGRTTG